MRKGLLVTGVLCWLVLALPAGANAEEQLLGDIGDGSLAVPVHLIDLFDEEGQKILPDDEPLLPFSMRQTCAQCHNVDTVSGGWHFNAVDANVSAGRPGQPWIFFDAGTATQIPVSYRPWPGTYRPKQLGLTSRQFVERFGRQTPGGGAGELDSDNPEEVVRGLVSGKLEINCMACHDADPAHDQAEYALQVARQNLRWAAAASCSFASVSGSAGDMPNTYDPFMPDVPEDPKLVPPTVVYGKNAFDHKNRVFFDIVRKVPNERCYFCHSNMDVKDVGQKWAVDEDVHLAAGMSCVDCHRHGLEHNITRGYEGEESVSSNILAALSTCSGCHTAGCLSAPVPTHPGIPPVHFDKLTCTSCHSGPWPASKTINTKTSRAHGLGIHTIDKSDDALPHIIYPVFARQPDGKIAPNKMVWPAFWGMLRDGNIVPSPVEVVRRAGEAMSRRGLRRFGDWPRYEERDMVSVLHRIASGGTGEVTPVYVAGGKAYYLDDENKLAVTEHEAARPYLWPIAHNVRPAAQSLGVHSCEDCHSTTSPFFFGQVAVDSPLESERDSVKKMIEFQGLNPFYTKAFAWSFMFRPWLKMTALASCGVLGAVLILYGLKALACILKVLAEEDD